MHRAALVALLLAAPAFAEPPLSALILGGGATEADAQLILGAYVNKLERHVTELVTFPKGQPGIVASAELPGLKPGFFVVTLGLCRDPAPVLARLKPLYPGLYVRPLTADVGPERCPTLTPDLVTAGDDRIVKAGPLVLTTFTTTAQRKDERGRDTPQGTLGFVLVAKATGEVRDVLSVDGASADQSGDGPTGWEYATCTASVAPEKKGFLVTRTCVDERTGCEKGEKAIPRAWTETQRVSIVDELLVAQPAKKTVTARAPCTAGSSGD